MLRTQIQLPEDLHRRLRRWARALGISLSEAVRRCVSERLSREEGAPSREARVRQALAACGKYEDPSGESRVGEEHDKHLRDIFKA
jgi:hypothetical protein